MTLVASILAVALSISSPSQYRHVEVVETNLLTAVGMGAVATPGAKLAYTDAAFLAEAYAERNIVMFGSHVEPSKMLVGKSVTSLSAIDHNLIFPRTFDSSKDDAYWVPNDGFLSSAVTLSDAVSVPTKAEHYNAHSSEELHHGQIWLDIFRGTNCFAVASLTNYPSGFLSGESLVASNVAALYRDLSAVGNLAHSTPGSSYGQGVAEIATDRERRIEAELVNYWDSLTHQWVYIGDYTPPDIVETNDNYVFYYTAHHSAVRKKSRGFEYDQQTHKWEDVTGVKKSSGYSDTSRSSYVFGSKSPSVSLPFGTNAVGTAIRGVKAFALAFLSYGRSGSGATPADKYGYAVVPVDASVSGNQIDLALGGPADMEIVEGVLGCYGETMPSGGQSLLQTLAEPADPSSSHSDYVEGDSRITINYRIQIIGVYVVADLDFNAKTL